MAQTFKKSERLCHKKVIESLFDRSNELNSSFSAFPIRVIFQKSEIDLELPKVLFTVSKRSFKKAVDRNWIKRRMREAYRLNKELLTSQNLYICFVFVGKQKVEFAEIEKSFVKILQRIQ
ncbi:ribonuclease P protein component [Jiulongibacter sp. NS-SX5]|uniref:ribonuclease P protein component n=1 Tax=Jiulongibacter sp. NS-SX5 TaxID=3463854 RepID=UPI004057CD23